MVNVTELARLFICWKGKRCVGLVMMAGIILLGLTSGLAFSQEQESWNKIVAAAKKEGKVVIYGVTSFRPMVKAMAPVFTKRYGIKVEFLGSRSREVRVRVKTEVRTGNQKGDLAQAGATSLPALLRDGALVGWLPPSINVVRPEIVKILDLPNLPLTPIYAAFKAILINTNLVPKGEEPKSWMDLLRPQWRGKILIDDPRSAGAGHGAFMSTLRHPSLGKEFHAKLAQNKPVFLGAGSYRQIATRVAQGEYPMGFPVDADAIIKFKGAPIRWIAPKEGVHHTVNIIGLVKNAPRPNAAKLFMEFVLTEEFQRLVSNTTTPVRIGIKAKRKEWSLDYAKLLPRPLTQSQKELEAAYRLAESLYGIR